MVAPLDGAVDPNPDPTMATAPARSAARLEIPFRMMPPVEPHHNATMRSLIALVLASSVAACARPAVEPATLVLRGGNFLTMEETARQPQALAVRGDRIVAVGAIAEVEPYIGPATEVLELAGLTVVPGFIDGHAHFMGLGQSRMVLDLREAQTWDAIESMVRDAAATSKPGEWIRGRGWHQEKWTAPPEPNVEGFPLHDSLSRVSPNNPVFLEHASGHAGFSTLARSRPPASLPPPGTRRAARS